MFGKLEYVVDENGVYSYGTVASTAYVSVAFYVLSIFGMMFRYRNSISRRKRMTLIYGICIWLAATIIQFFAKYLLISGIAVVLMILIIYLSFENPKVYVDEKTGALNYAAFQRIIKEISGKYYVVTLVVKDMYMLNEKVGHSVVRKIIMQIIKYASDLFHCDGYYLNDGVIAFVIMKDENLSRESSVLESRMKDGWNANDSILMVNVQMITIECPKYASDYDHVMQLISFVLAEHSSDFNKTINDALVSEKIRYNKIEKMICDAIENDGFDVYYQPIFSTKQNKFISSEALIRLKDTETVGYVSPEEFIPIAEKKELIIKVGEIVFEKVCSFIKKARSNGLELEYVEVNLSAVQGIDARIPTRFYEIMKKYGVEPSSVNLEITETTAVESEKMLENNMNAFREMGCSFSMDDFGTGYSNLSEMAEVEYDLIKLDKSLIWPCFEEKPNEKAKVILQNVTNMLIQMNRHIVAEGVETEEMVKKLTELGVDYLQGYYFSKPISEDKYFEFLSKMN